MNAEIGLFIYHLSKMCQQIKGGGVKTQLPHQLSFCFFTTQLFELNYNLDLEVYI